jgi:hypothetical protein
MCAVQDAGVAATHDEANSLISKANEAIAWREHLEASQLAWTGGVDGTTDSLAGECNRLLLFQAITPVVSTTFRNFECESHWQGAIRFADFVFRCVPQGATAGTSPRRAKT